MKKKIIYKKKTFLCRNFDGLLPVLYCEERKKKIVSQYKYCIVTGKARHEGC